MKKINVLLIAAGGIGFRHFQALLNCRSDFELHVADIDEAAIERAKSYEKEQGNGRAVYYYSAVPEIEQSMHFRLAIIATSSLVRRTVFEQLMERCTVETVLFEKVLFPRIKDYEEVGELLRKNCITAYVNCARRVQPVYQKLREEMCCAKRVYAKIRGGNWGLACNSVHMVDLFAYLSPGHPEYITCNGDFLENQLYDSKRKGYIEFYGKLTGKIGEKTTYLIECGHEETGIVIELFTDTVCYCIDEAKGILTVQDLDSGALTERQFQLVFVSRSTTWVADKLLSGQTVELTGYEESAMVHIPVLRELLKKKNEIQGKEDEICPIT